MADTICIVTPSHLAISSRTVKEADALYQAGYRVTVVFGQGDSSTLTAYDATIATSRDWRPKAVNWNRDRRWGRWAFSGLRHRLCRKAWRVMEARFFAPLVLGRVYPELARAAAAERADLYIGHFPEGLAAAGKAAERTGALLAFDSEDFHLGEGAPSTQQAVEVIQGKYLPECAYVSASSEAIGKCLTERYPSLRPVTVYNVFSQPNAGDSLDKAPHRRRHLSICWVSQTIGMDRGLQDAIRAVGLLDSPAELHIRGTFANGAERELKELAERAGVLERLHFYPQIAPWELIASVASHDVGLALEQPCTLNHQVCAAIKLFLYFSAGVAVAATDTPGQREVLELAPGAGALYLPGDYEALAAILNRWQSEPDALAAARKASARAADERFNWAVEGRKLVAVVNSVLGR
ncbi:MAG: hypothetical protein P4L43_10510 [Syntrophobacteraceae bacterium]|nr:hypothetical protein [Syntrophobacteraceae bacterium]